MIKTIVATVHLKKETRVIEKVEGMGAPRFRIKTMKGRYLGKTKDGGYTTLFAASTAAQAVRG